MNMSSRKHTPTRQEIKARIDEETRRVIGLIYERNALYVSRDEGAIEKFERLNIQIQDAEAEIAHLKLQLTQVSW